VEHVAPSRSTILRTGETGPGRESIAKASHANSPRAGGLFVAVKSGSLPAGLLESTPFGHVKGAWSSAPRAPLPEKPAFTSLTRRRPLQASPPAGERPPGAGPPLFT